MYIIWIVVPLIPIIIGGIWLFKREVNLKKAGKEIKITFFAFSIKKWWMWIIFLVLSLNRGINFGIIDFLIGIIISFLIMWIWWLFDRRVDSPKKKIEESKKEAKTNENTANHKKYCSKCGKEYQDDNKVKFCGHCGSMPKEL